MISYFTYYLTDFLSKFYPPGRLDLAQYGSLRHRYNKSGLRADKPVSFLSWYAEMILNSTRPWIWTEFSYFRLQLEFSSRKFLHTRYGFVSQYEQTLSLETGAFNYISRGRQVFFCNADFTLYVYFFLAGCHLRCFGDGYISAGDVFEKGGDGVSAIVKLE